MCYYKIEGVSLSTKKPQKIITYNPLVFKGLTKNQKINPTKCRKFIVKPNIASIFAPAKTYSNVGLATSSKGNTDKNIFKK